MTIVFVLWDPHRPLRCLHHHKPGVLRQAGGDPGGALDMDSNACRAAEVERKVPGQRFFFCAAVLETQQLVAASCYLNPAKSVSLAAPRSLLALVSARLARLSGPAKVS